MDQQRVWEHFQNEDTRVFRQADGRLRFLARQLGRRTKSGARVLNVGVGAGQFEGLALGLGMRVHSLDPDGRAVARLNERPAMKGRAKVGRLESVPFPDDFFDAVVASEVLEHLTDDSLDQALAEIHRVLSRGGVIMGTVPAREELSEQLTVCPHCGGRFHRWGHVQSFDEGRLRTLLARRFEVETVKERFLPALSGLGRKEKAVSLLNSFVKHSLLRAGVRWPGASLYFCAAKERGEPARGD